MCLRQHTKFAYFFCRNRTMAQPAASKKVKEKKLVFEKVKFDPLSNPEVFGIGIEQDDTLSPTNVDSGWESDEKKEASNKSKKPTNAQNETKDNNDNDEEEETEYNYDKIEANIERAKKKKKVDFRAEMTSDSQDIDDLLLFQSKEKNEKEKIQQIDEELLYEFTCNVMNVSLHKTIIYI